MRHFLRTDALTRAELDHVFELADDYDQGQGPGFDGAAALFFPPASIRTRASFERGLATMGLQPILFPPETLDKSESHRDVAGYLADFCDVAVVRHYTMAVLEGLAASDALPVVNAMTEENHPCEVTADLWAMRKLGRDIHAMKFVLVGLAESNIALAWKEAARAFGLDMTQSCAPGYQFDDMPYEGDLLAAVRDADAILVDSPGPYAELMRPWQITDALLDAAPAHCLVNPCPPFMRGREMSASVVDGGRWVGYGFKQALVPVQQAAVAWALGE